MHQTMISKVLEHNEIRKRAYNPGLTIKDSSIITGIRLKVLHTFMRLHLILIAMKCYKNPLDWIRSLLYLIRLRRQFLGDFELKKIARVNGKYYMGIYIPAWFSKGFEYFVINELKSFKPVSTPSLRFNNVFLAVTSKCALQCEHCYEWERLNKKEEPSVKDLLEIINKVRVLGTTQIHLTGGEPLMKIDLILELLRLSPKDIDYWIGTSGYSLNENSARILKEAGITGLVISLDHFKPDEHNKFRRSQNAFNWAIEAVRSAVASKMVVALSLCATKKFISEENLIAYMNLAESLGVSFVQIIEPKAVGHYKNKSVELSPEQIDLLERFHVKMNFTHAGRSYPVIGYHEQYQRRKGCLSAGKRAIYLDIHGNLHACPFCQKIRGNILDSEFDNELEKLRIEGCNSVKC